MNCNKNFQESHCQTYQITRESFLKVCLEVCMGKRMADAVDKHVVVVTQTLYVSDMNITVVFNPSFNT